MTSFAVDLSNLAHFPFRTKRKIDGSEGMQSLVSMSLSVREVLQKNRREGSACAPPSPVKRGLMLSSVILMPLYAILLPLLRPYMKKTFYAGKKQAWSSTGFNK